MANDNVCWEEQRNLDWNKPDLSMVAIRDSADSVVDDLAVFPPINHENLQVSSFTDGSGCDRNRDSPSVSSSPSLSSRGSVSSSSFSSPPSDSDGQPQWTTSDFDQKLPWKSSELDGKSPRSPSDFEEGSPLSDKVGKAPWKTLNRSVGLGLADGVRYWWKLLLVLVHTKFQKMATRFSACNFSPITGIIWSFFPAMGVTIWWWTRVRARRRRRKGETMDQLRTVIKEKEEKILQLLHQIAQMNEILVKHHKDIASRIPN